MDLTFCLTTYNPPPPLYNICSPLRSSITPVQLVASNPGPIPHNPLQCPQLCTTRFHCTVLQPPTPLPPLAQT